MPTDINQFLVHESGRITYDIYRREQYFSPWISQPKKVAWPEGMGETIDNIMWERPYVETENEWAQMAINNGTGNSCIPPVDDVKFSQTLRRTSLYHKAVHSPYFCVTDLLYAGKRESQMRSVEWGLGDIVRLYWVNWNRDGFTKWANKYVIEPGLAYTDESDGLTFPAVPATSRLTNGILDYFHNLLDLEQGNRHALSTQNGRPLYGLITDSFTSRFLIRGDDAIREDFRYGDADQLLKPLGCTHTYNGFVHMIDQMPPRYNYNPALVEDPVDDLDTDPWVFVPPYVLDETDPASPKKVVNPDWLAAEYQDTFIFVKDAYQLRVPSSVAGVSKAKFNPQMYMGEFRWQNVVNLDEDSPAHNPDGKLGRFRGVMGSGVEPINPHVMFALRHKVCPVDFGMVNCPD